VAALGLSLGLAALVLATACRRGVPVIDIGPKPAVARGTITGSVRGPEGTSPIAGRTIEVTNVTTGERQTVQTSSTGGFTIELPPGKYRLALALREGETIVKHPDVVTLDRGEIDSHVEFVIAFPKVMRPRGPAYRLDNGLGAPIA
jgi:carboxypeptidase family protein